MAIPGSHASGTSRLRIESCTMRHTTWPVHDRKKPDGETTMGSQQAGVPSQLPGSPRAQPAAGAKPLGVGGSVPVLVALLLGAAAAASSWAGEPILQLESGRTKVAITSVSHREIILLNRRSSRHRSRPRVPRGTVATSANARQPDARSIRIPSRHGWTVASNPYSTRSLSGLLWWLPAHWKEQTTTR